MAKEGVHPFRRQVIAIGASTGGIQAVHGILKALPVSIPGIVIVQHIPPVFSRMFAERLDAQTSFYVKEAEDGDCVLPGSVLIAPGNQHMRLHKTSGCYHVKVCQGARVNGHCPSVDVLFESIAHAAGDQAIGIILTGMGSDGALGLLHMRQKGARTIGQDRESSVVYGMSKAALEVGAVEKEVPLTLIPETLMMLLN